MKIAVFAYDFPHKKTQDFLFQLFMEGIKVDCVIAAPWIKLNIPQKNMRTAPRHIVVNHPRDICLRMNIPYYSCPHASEECAEILRKHNIDIGIIAGARILKKHVIDAVNVGVINFHPGIIPECRGLDTVEWAVLDNLDIGVTAHFINERIDTGNIICKEVCPLYKDDTFQDIWLRVNETQIKMLSEVMKMVLANPNGPWEEVTDESRYYKSLPQERECELIPALEKRLKRLVE